MLPNIQISLREQKKVKRGGKTGGKANFENSIRDSPYLVHFEIHQKRGQNEERKRQKEGLEGARSKEGEKRRLRGRPLKDGTVWQLC